MNSLLETQLIQARNLHQSWKNGYLGGEVMPEDAKPATLPRTGEATLAYFTLPMALNYQRNSYKLWEAATKTWQDETTAWVFNPIKAATAKFPDLQAALLKHKLALQPNKHPQTWQRICETLSNHHNGRIEKLLSYYDFDIARIKQHVQVNAKAGFPYLSGMKICNYWLYVLTQYTDYPFTNRSEINIAPDTHVIQASQKLGIISPEDTLRADVQKLAEARWKMLLTNSGLEPIDLHTPLWLWSRAGFPILK